MTEKNKTPQTYEEWEEEVKKYGPKEGPLYKEIAKDFRFKNALKECIKCGTCVSICPAANFYDYSPRDIMQIMYEGKDEEILKLCKEAIYWCAQCHYCIVRCPRGNQPGNLVMILRDKVHEWGLAKEGMTPFTRVLKILLMTGTQLSPDMIQGDFFPDWGPRTKRMGEHMPELRKRLGEKVEGAQLRGVDVLSGVESAWRVSPYTMYELQKLWMEGGGLDRVGKSNEFLAELVEEEIEDMEDEGEDEIKERMQEMKDVKKIKPEDIYDEPTIRCANCVVKRKSEAPYPDEYEKATHLKETLYKLEDKGELKIMPVIGKYEEHETIPGITKKVHLDHFWEHKSCNMCSINPGAAKSLWWTWDQLGIDYMNPDTQTSCNGWMYWATSVQDIPNEVAILARNWHECYRQGRNFNIHCITSFATYTEARHWLVESAEVREKASKYLESIGRELVVPEEIIHVSDVIYALRDKLAKKAKYTLEGIRVAPHYGDHYWKGLMDNAIGGYRPKVVHGVIEAFGGTAADYSMLWQCCGFGFRHIVMNRTMTRSQLYRKLKSIRDEAKADLIMTNCPGCANTLDKNQWIQRARETGDIFEIPTLFPYQVVAMCMGADPYDVASVHFNGTAVEPFLDKAKIPYNKDFYEQFEK